MKPNNLIPLLTCSLETPKESHLFSSHLVNDDFLKLHGILLNFCNELRKVISTDDAFSGTFTNPIISINSQALLDNTISLTIFTHKTEIMHDSQSITQSIMDFVTLSIDLIVIERYFSRRSYTNYPSNLPGLILNENNKSLSISYSHEIISSIANRIQNTLVNLNKIDEDLYITVGMNGETISIPGISEAIQPVKKHKYDTPEQCTAILRNGNQAINACSFLITLGTAAPKKQTHVESAAPNELTEIRKKARYEDTVLVEIYRLEKELRGITSRIDDIEFVKLITDDLTIQMQLLPIDSHDQD